jgi:hypothetical protein
MAHFAQIDENNKVINVLVVDNSAINNLPFPESEQVGINYLNSFLPVANYKQTSYNANFRANYGGIGFTFVPEWNTHGGFRDDQPFPSWVLNNNTLQWEAPVALAEGLNPNFYSWNEEELSWVPIVNTIKPVVIG